MPGTLSAPRAAWRFLQLLFVVALILSASWRCEALESCELLGARENTDDVVSVAFVGTRSASSVRTVFRNCTVRNVDLTITVPEEAEGTFLESEEGGEREGAEAEAGWVPGMVMLAFDGIHWQGGSVTIVRAATNEGDTSLTPSSPTPGAHHGIRHVFIAVTNSSFLRMSGHVFGISASSSDVHHHGEAESSGGDTGNAEGSPQPAATAGGIVEDVSLIFTNVAIEVTSASGGVAVAGVVGSPALVRKLTIDFRDAIFSVDCRAANGCAVAGVVARVEHDYPGHSVSCLSMRIALRHCVVLVRGRDGVAVAGAVALRNGAVDLVVRDSLVRIDGGSITVNAHHFLALAAWLVRLSGHPSTISVHDCTTHVSNAAVVASGASGVAAVGMLTRSDGSLIEVLRTALLVADSSVTIRCTSNFCVGVGLMGHTWVADSVTNVTVADTRLVLLHASVDVRGSSSPIAAATVASLARAHSGVVGIAAVRNFTLACCESLVLSTEHAVDVVVRTDSYRRAGIVSISLFPTSRFAIVGALVWTEAARGDCATALPHLAGGEPPSLLLHSVLRCGGAIGEVVTAGGATPSPASAGESTFGSLLLLLLNTSLIANGTSTVDPAQVFPSATFIGKADAALLQLETSIMCSLHPGADRSITRTLPATDSHSMTMSLSPSRTRSGLQRDSPLEDNSSSIHLTQSPASEASLTALRSLRLTSLGTRTGSLSMARTGAPSPSSPLPTTVSHPPVPAPTVIASVTLVGLVPLDSAEAYTAAATTSAVAAAVASPTSASQVARVGGLVRALECVIIQDDPRPSYLEMPLQVDVGGGKYEAYAGSLLLTVFVFLLFPFALHTSVWWKWRVRRRAARWKPSQALASPACRDTKLLKGIAALHAVTVQYFVPNSVAAITTLLSHASNAHELGVGVASLVVVVFIISVLLARVASSQLFGAVLRERPGRQKGGAGRRKAEDADEAIANEVDQSRDAVDDDAAEVVPDKKHSQNPSVIDFSARQHFFNKEQGSGFVEAMFPFFDGAKSFERKVIRCYAFEELALSCTIAMITSIRRGSCVLVGISVAAIAALHVAYLAFARPYRTRLDAFFSLLMGVLQLALGALVAYSLMRGGSGARAGFAIGALLTAIFAEMFIQAMVQSAWSCVVFTRRNALQLQNELDGEAGLCLPGDEAEELGGGSPLLSVVHDGGEAPASGSFNNPLVLLEEMHSFSRPPRGITACRAFGSPRAGGGDGATRPHVAAGDDDIASVTAHFDEPILPWQPKN